MCCCVLPFRQNTKCFLRKMTTATTSSSVTATMTTRDHQREGRRREDNRTMPQWQKNRRRQRKGGGTTRSTVVTTTNAVPAWHPERSRNAEHQIPFDEPTPGFGSIPEALEEIKRGKFVVVLDDESRKRRGLNRGGRYDDARKHGVHDSTHERTRVRVAGR